MHLLVATAAALLASALLSGCDRRSSAPTAAAAGPRGDTTTLVGPGRDPWLDDGQPLSGLPRLKLLVGPKELNTEVCLTHASITKGMMWRTNFPATNGMLFVFRQPFQAAFWMKNVPIPIDVGYLDSEGTLLEVHRLEKFNTNPAPSKEANVQFALETPEGWYARHGIRPGTLIRTERGTLPETFLAGNRQR